MARGQRRSSLAIWVVAAAAGWATIAWLAIRLFTDQPRRAAFDLDLLLGAGRAVAAGGSPYDPAIIAGHAPRAVDLFFSYPPIVGQAMVPLAGLPLGLVYLVWSVAAIALFAVVVLRLRTVIGSTTSTATLATASVALAAATLPFIIAILFGNLDAFFPALYGLALVAAMSGRRRDSVVGGIAIAIGAATKLYPVGLGLWFAIRALRDRGRDRGGSALVTLAAAIGAGVIIVGIS
ncbi:MAG TPA: glycosyltransferase 87 family protein, partial [Candidatus Limnocylindrales bacterium]